MNLSRFTEEAVKDSTASRGLHIMSGHPLIIFSFFAVFLAAF